VGLTGSGWRQVAHREAQKAAESVRIVPGTMSDDIAFYDKEVLCGLPTAAADILDLYKGSLKPRYSYVFFVTISSRSQRFLQLKSVHFKGTQRNRLHG
jgi:hypothetical protein